MLQNRDDVFIKTIVKVIRSLGGEIEIKVRFKDCDFPLSFPAMEQEEVIGS